MFVITLISKLIQLHTLKWLDNLFIDIIRAFVRVDVG